MDTTLKHGGQKPMCTGIDLKYRKGYGNDKYCLCYCLIFGFVAMNRDLILHVLVPFMLRFRRSPHKLATHKFSLRSLPGRENRGETYRHLIRILALIYTRRDLKGS